MFFPSYTEQNTGFPLCFGVFQAHYSTLPEFKDSPYIAVVGTIASGMSYLAAPLIIPFVKRYSRYRYLMIWIGCKLFGTSSQLSPNSYPNLANVLKSRAYLSPRPHRRLLRSKSRHLNPHARRHVRHRLYPLLLPYPQHGQRVLDRAARLRVRALV